MALHAGPIVFEDYGLVCRCEAQVRVRVSVKPVDEHETETSASNAAKPVLARALLV